MSRAASHGLTAEGYVNKYHGSWRARHNELQKQLDEAMRRKGRPKKGAEPARIPSLMPLPVPLSGFLWPQVCVCLIGSWSLYALSVEHHD